MRATSQRGIVAISAVLTVMLLTVLGSTLLMRSSHENQLSRMASSHGSAFFLAESSIDRALYTMRGGQFGNVPSAALAGGTYWAEVNPSGPPLQFLVTGHGDRDALQRNLQARVQLTALSVFQGALFGAQLLEVSGSVITDSYDSSVAPYDPAQPGHLGHVGTNATSDGGVVISGSIAINGQVMVGAGAPDPNDVVNVSGGSAIITGTPPVVSQTNNLLMPPMSPPAGLPCPNLKITNDNYPPLTAGEYCFHNVDIGGGGLLAMDGSGYVTIYITGSFSATGNSTIGKVGDPTQLTMILTSTAHDMTLQGDLTGSTEFYGGIYAPTSEIKINGNAEIFGSVVAQQVNVSGDAKIHYDHALSQLEDPVGVYETRVLSWREL